MKTHADEIEQIKEILPLLPETALHEIRDFAFYLADREERRRALVARVLKAEQEPDTVTCRSAEEFMKAIESAEDDDQA
jgi:hypothetical protein